MLVSSALPVVPARRFSMAASVSTAAPLEAALIAGRRRQRSACAVTVGSPANACNAASVAAAAGASAAAPPSAAASAAAPAAAAAASPAAPTAAHAAPAHVMAAATAASAAAVGATSARARGRPAKPFQNLKPGGVTINKRIQVAAAMVGISPASLQPPAQAAVTVVQRGAQQRLQDAWSAANGDRNRRARLVQMVWMLPWQLHASSACAFMGAKATAFDDAAKLAASLALAAHPAPALRGVHSSKTLVLQRDLLRYLLDHSDTNYRDWRKTRCIQEGPNDAKPRYEWRHRQELVRL
jgi:hypothetical protein